MNISISAMRPVQNDHKTVARFAVNVGDLVLFDWGLRRDATGALRADPPETRGRVSAVYVPADVHAKIRELATAAFAETMGGTYARNSR